MELISRKGYRVRISHCQLPGNDCWSLKINILFKTGSGIQNLQIPYSMTFDSQEEARRHVFSYGGIFLRRKDYGSRDQDPLGRETAVR
jgi:hypothetical protein